MKANAEKRVVNTTTKAVIKLDRDELFDANPEAVARLAQWLKVAPPRKPGEGDGSYGARCVNPIQKAEKALARRPRQESK